MAKYVIVGGVAGGATAAARLRRLDEDAEIVLLERGDYISYANCGLPYYAGGVIRERSKLFVMTPEKFRATLNVDVRTGHEALSIDKNSRTVVIVEKKTGRRYTESYDALVLSPGAEPLRPRIPGIDDERIFTLRTVPDIDAIKEKIDALRPERALVVGAGFIGLEMAENLHALGLHVSVIEMLPQVMAPLDPEMAAAIHQELRQRGVGLVLGDGVQSIAERAEGGRLLGESSGVGGLQGHRQRRASERLLVVAGVEARRGPLERVVRRTRRAWLASLCVLGRRGLDARATGRRHGRAHRVGGRAAAAGEQRSGGEDGGDEASHGSKKVRPC